MTDTEVELDTLAQRIAERGHDALVARLRQAYADAAAAHADLISLDDDRIETMVQAAARHADGLQWRRALAGVAADDLGISDTEALKHPAVARAQSLAGAPSYEQSLAEIIAQPVPPADHRPEAVLPEPEPPTPEPEPEPEPAPPLPEPPAPELPAAEARSVSAADSELPPTAEHDSLSSPEAAARADELETVEADDVVLELLPEPDPIEYETQALAAPEPEEPRFEQPEPEEPGFEQREPAEPEFAEPEFAEPEFAEPVLGETEPDEPELVIPAIHMGGVANLPTKREGLGVRLSMDGLDILQGEREIIGRLIWDEIETLEVPHQRVRRRRSEPRARLLVRTQHGDASFDVPGVPPDELRDRVEPLVALYGRH